MLLFLCQALIVFTVLPLIESLMYLIGIPTSENSDEEYAFPEESNWVLSKFIVSETIDKFWGLDTFLIFSHWYYIIIHLILIYAYDKIFP